MLTVEKIGGTSMSRFQDVLNNIIIGTREKREYYNRVFVVSAYNDVTNWLLEHKKTGEPFEWLLKSKGALPWTVTRIRDVRRSQFTMKRFGHGSAPWR